MSLTELRVRNLRCIEQADLRLHPSRNLIVGGNGSGKTSLLESIYLLGRGRSFRTRNSQRLIRFDAPALTVFGEAIGTIPKVLAVQVARAGGTTARIGGAPVSSLAELALALPTQVIEPGLHRLVEEGGTRRRKWLDWGVFHVEPRFVPTWIRYVRATRQRNAALRRQPEQARTWDVEVSRQGEVIDGLRAQVIKLLEPYWRETVAGMTGLDIELAYVRGWPADQSLRDAIAATWDADRALGATRCGPHRADILLRVEGRLAREVLSRGQQKLLAAAMILAQLFMLQAERQIVPLLLLDDPAAELDVDRLAHFMSQVDRLQCQLVVSSLDVGAGRFAMPDRVFHVERGGVRHV